MSVSLRSHLLVGTAAVATASAVIVSAGTISASSLPAVKVPVAADVALAAWYGNFDPLGDIMDTLQYANLYLFSIAEPPATAFDRAGIVPDLLAAGFPSVTQYALNASDYVNQVGNYLLQDYDSQADILPGALRALSWAINALPLNAIALAQQVATGNVYKALQTVQFAVINPLQYAAYQVLNLGLYELGGVAARAAAVVTAVAEWVPGAIRSLADDVTVFTNTVGQTLSQTIQLAQAFPFSGRALNLLVHQLLGSNGNTEPGRTYPTIPDALINQTIGEGGFIITTPPNTPPPEQETVEAPSIRQKGIELRDALVAALETAVPEPEAPPFTIQGDFFDIQQSSIPTPWAPTLDPFIQAPAAAARSDRLVRSAQAEPSTQIETSAPAEPSTQMTQAASRASAEPSTQAKRGKSAKSAARTHHRSS
jgi:hypothetical protein